MTAFVVMHDCGEVKLFATKDKAYRYGIQCIKDDMNRRLEHLDMYDKDAVYQRAIDSIEDLCICGSTDFMWIEEQEVIE